jgi:hypothetical protein
MNAPWTPIFKDLNRIEILDNKGQLVATLSFECNLLSENFNSKKESMIKLAHLIIAAPEMLFDLEWIVSKVECDEMKMSEPMLNHLKKKIAKARDK